MQFNDILIHFYKMETDLHLFDRKDANGIYYWDVVRFDIFDELTEGGQSFNVSEVNRKTINMCTLLNAVKASFSLFRILYTRNRTFVYLSSRNKYKGTSILFDQNAHDLLSLLESDKVVINESFAQIPTVYDCYTKINSVASFSRIVPKPSYIPYEYFDILCSEIKSYFPKCTIKSQRLASLYIDFYKNRIFYRWLFRTINTSRVLITQNGILKGLFAAARDLGINVYEFQHGIISDGHLAYSYPKISGIDDKVYRPSHLLTLSDFWLKDCYVPYSHIITLGNDYFKPQISVNSKPSRNKILVVSSTFMRKELFDFLALSKTSLPDFKSYDFVYKLHPNEFENVNVYKEHFREYDNVIVATNEKNIAQWMEECSTMVTILSTAAYEALQCNRKVIVLKRLNYQMMKLIFNCDNVYTVDNPEEMQNALNKEMIPISIEFFSPFNKEVAYEILH